jgi:hypothetical protein
MSLFFDEFCLRRIGLLLSAIVIVFIFYFHATETYERNEILAKGKLIKTKISRTENCKSGRCFYSIINGKEREGGLLIRDDYDLIAGNFIEVFYLDNSQYIVPKVRKKHPYNYIGEILGLICAIGCVIMAFKGKW